jgi:hypothetical protein
MVRYYKLIFYFVIISTNIYADNSVGNLGGGIINNKCNTKSNLPPMRVSYNIFDYKLTPNQLTKFINKYYLGHSNITINSKNIAYINLIDSTKFNNLVENLINETKSGHIVGSNLCIINCGECGGTFGTQPQNININFKNSITFKITQDLNKYPSGHIDYFYAKYINSVMIYPTLSFSILLPQILHKKYIIITKNVNDKILFGQIILVSFNE